MKKGFTLIELLAVIVILAIIAAITIVMVNTIITNSKKAGIKASLKGIELASKYYYIDNKTDYNMIDLTGDKINYDGNVPEKGYIQRNSLKKLRVYIYMDGYCAVKGYNSNDIKLTKTTKEECSFSSGRLIDSTIVDNSDGTDLENYRIYGNTIDGISLGENSRNLIDMSKIIIGNNNNYAGTPLKDMENGTTTLWNIDFQYSSGGIVKVKKGTVNGGSEYLILYPQITLSAGDYYFKVNLPRMKSTDNAYRTDGAIVLNDTKYRLISTNDYSYLSFNITEETVLKKIYIYIGNGAIVTEDFDFYMQLEEGTQATDYVPYRYINVNVSGKNLFDKMQSKITEIRNDTESELWGNIAFDNTWVINNLKPNTTYSISYTAACVRVPEYTSEFSNNLGFGLYPEVSGHMNISLLTSQYINEGEVVDINKTFTTPEYINEPGMNYKLRVYTNRYLNNGVAKLSSVIFSNIQIEEGDTATPYEPYQTPRVTTIDLTGYEPLRKVGDVADYLDYETQRIVRRIGVNESNELYVLDIPIYENIVLPSLSTIKGYNKINMNSNIQPSKIEIVR